MRHIKRPGASYTSIRSFDSAKTRSCSSVKTMRGIRHPLCYLHSTCSASSRSTWSPGSVSALIAQLAEQIGICPHLIAELLIHADNHGIAGLDVFQRRGKASADLGGAADTPSGG